MFAAELKPFANRNFASASFSYFEDGHFMPIEAKLTDMSDASLAKELAAREKVH